MFKRRNKNIKYQSFCLNLCNPMILGYHVIGIRSPHYCLGVFSLLRKNYLSTRFGLPFQPIYFYMQGLNIKLLTTNLVV